MSCTLRLSHRALEVHARDVGYDHRSWLRAAITLAGVATDADVAPPVYPRAMEVLVGAHRDLLDAMVCSVDDRMGVPEHLHRGVSRMITVFMLADTA